MRIAFDEHVPPAIFDVMEALARNGHIADTEFFSARTYSPGPKQMTDIPWVQAFADDGGDILISGEKKMRSIPEVHAAISETGVKAFYLPRQWNSWDMATRTGFILIWLKKIIAHANDSANGTSWLIPLAWQSGTIKKVSIGDG